MEIIYSHCAGMDVHKQTVVVCLITPNGKEIRSFGTMTGSLLEMADWLVSNNCKAVAMVLLPTLNFRKLLGLKFRGKRG